MTVLTAWGRQGSHVEAGPEWVSGTLEPILTC